MPVLKIISQSTQDIVVSANTVDSNAIPIRGATTCSFIAVVSTFSATGNASGFLQVSNDAPDIVPVNWTNLVINNTIGSVANFSFERVNAPGNWVRMRMTSTNGTINVRYINVLKGPD